MVLTGAQVLTTRGLGGPDPEAEEAVYANSAYVEGKPMVTDSLKLTENCQLLHSGSAFMLSVVFIN